MAANGENLLIGQTNYAPANFERWNGLIDEIRIYNRALNQSEIQTDMNTPLRRPGRRKNLV